MHALKSLDADLRQHGSGLVVRAGNPLEVLTDLLAESGAEVIYAETDFSPYARRRDEMVGSHLPLRLVKGASVHPLSAVVKADGSPYTVFTPFSKTWRALPLSIQPPGDAPQLFPWVTLPDSQPLPYTKPPFQFPTSEARARRLLVDFCADGMGRYGLLRDRMDMESTSHLSPYLRFGLVSARRAVYEARSVLDATTDAAGRRGIETWINELIWREFYQMILYQFPFVLETAFRPDLRRIKWRESETDLLAWQTGQTGYPVVDAGMRQLLATGWMHNRARMITASFLVKDLLINWQDGERWFMQHLVDGDPASNNGGWQWTAGVGTDAAPYFRVFSPLLQGKKFDPFGDYIRRWVPELALVPTEYIHRPELMPEKLQQDVKCVVGRNYPRPIVAHALARERVLTAYKAARG
jgi:deoxyribodipyrimidine photo-lyase